MIVTGYGTPEAEREAEKLGVFKFLNKPVPPDDLCDFTAEALASTFGASAGAVALPANEIFPFPYAPARPIPKVVEREAAEAKRGVLKSLGLLIAAPFLGLAYVIFLPFIGFGMLVALGYRSLRTRLVRGERA